MKPLIVLIAVFLISGCAIGLTRGVYDWQLAGRIGMAAMLVFTAIGHFAFTKGMAMMLPAFLPGRKAVVLLTGLIELMAAAGLLLPAFIHTTGQVLIIFFSLILPANIYAAAHRIDYQSGSHDGPGLRYLWLRVPMQLLFIAWVYWAAL